MMMVVIFWTELNPGGKIPIIVMSIKISTIYIKERWSGIVIEKIKTVNHPSKLQIEAVSGRVNFCEVEYKERKKKK